VAPSNDGDGQAIPSSSAGRRFFSKSAEGDLCLAGGHFYRR
jgi:hypothetical protein